MPKNLHGVDLPILDPKETEDNRLADDALGASLFPNYAMVLNWYAREVEGLTDAQLDFHDDREEWSMWSIRRQVSHVAFAHFRWLYGPWAPIAFKPEDRLPEFDADALSGYDRCFDDETNRSMGRIFQRLTEGVGMVQLIVGRETVGEMLGKEVDRVVDPEERYPSGDSALDFWWAAERVNPDLRAIEPAKPGDPYLFRMNLVGMIRQLYFECLLHLHTIQRLKMAQGLEVKVDIPKEGYLLLPAFSGEPEGRDG